MKQYNLYSRQRATRFYQQFVKEDFYLRVQNALLLYDVVMKPNIIRFEICDKYV
jgi:mitochondrial inner membrane protease ATP23